MTAPRNHYKTIAASLRKKIETGQIATKLPSMAQLATEYGVCLSTIAHALSVLKDEGLIKTRQGAGAYVATSRDARPAADRFADLILTRKPGQMLPTEIEMTEIIGVSRTALRSAIAYFEGRGHLRRGVQRRLVVRELPTREDP